MIRDALDRAAAAEDDRQRFPGLRSLAYLHMMRADFEKMAAVADELMAIAEQEQDPLLLSEAHLLTGLSRAWLDDLPSSLDHYDQAVEHFEATRSGHVDFRVGPNPGVVANVVSGLTQWMVGCPEAASSTMQRALDLAAGPRPPLLDGLRPAPRRAAGPVATGPHRRGGSSRRAAGHRRGARLPDVARPGPRVGRDGHGRLGRRRRRTRARRGGLRAVQGPVGPAGVLAGAAHDPRQCPRHGRPR